MDERREAGQIIKELMQERHRKISYKKYVDMKLKEKLKVIEGVVSMAYIAQYYFGKDETWLQQRINLDIVNGELAVLNDEEFEQLKNALYDIRSKLSQAIKNIS